MEGDANADGDANLSDHCRAVIRLDGASVATDNAHWDVRPAVDATRREGKRAFRQSGHARIVPERSYCGKGEREKKEKRPASVTPEGTPRRVEQPPQFNDAAR